MALNIFDALTLFDVLPAACCKDCGTDIDGDARFCSGCGIAIEHKSEKVVSILNLWGPYKWQVLGLVFGLAVLWILTVTPLGDKFLALIPGAFTGL